MMTRCEQCGAEALSESRFCPKCGASLSDNASTPAKPGATSGRAASVEPTKADRVREAMQPNNRGDDAEQHMWEGTYSPKAMIGAWVFAAIVTVAAIIVVALFFSAEGMVWIVLGVILLLYWAGLALMLAYRRLSVSYELTTQRFIHKAGLLSRKSDRIEVIDMDDVTYEQGIVQRMMGVGSIKIISSDRSHPELTLYGIENVQQVAGMIDDVRRAERRRRGIHIEAV